MLNYNKTLTVIDKKGNIKWKMKDDRFLNWADAAPTFSPDGNMLYVQGSDVSVLAIDVDMQTLKWAFGNKVQRSSPVIDNNGNIFIIPGESKFFNKRKLYSLKPEGVINWEFKFGANTFMDNTEPTIDHNGNIYFGADSLYSLSNSGKLRWKMELGSVINTPLICDVNNVIYVGMQNRTNGVNKIIAVNDDGEILWEILDNLERALGVSPALNEKGILFYPTWDNQNGVYLIIN